MAKLPIRESRKGREGILVRAQEANGEIRWPAYRTHRHTQRDTHTQKHINTEKYGNTHWWHKPNEIGRHN